MTMFFKALALACVLIVAVLLLLCLVRAVRGPRVTDRIVAVNMIGTMTIAVIALLAAVLEESYLLDVCLIYAMISFLSIVVLTRVYLGVFRARQAARRKEDKPCSKD